MSRYKLNKIIGELSPDDKKLMIEGLLSHHAKSGHHRNSEVFSVTAKNENKTIGTISVTFLWNGMEINSLWVDEDFRNQGIGSSLMNEVEKEAKKRGIDLCYTNTFSWQACPFYEKNGYTLYGKLDGFPKGESLSYYCKKI